MGQIGTEQGQIDIGTWREIPLGAGAVEYRPLDLAMGGKDGTDLLDCGLREAKAHHACSRSSMLLIFSSSATNAG